MDNVGKTKYLTINGIRRCRFFQQGVSDYFSGKRDEFFGAKYYGFDAQSLYENGRLVAATTQRRNITNKDIADAYNSGDIPPYSERT